MSGFTRAEACAVALAEAFRGSGEVLASPFGALPTLGARLAKLSFEPELLLTDGVARILADVPPLSGDEGAAPAIEGWMPFRSVFDTLWAGRRHVMMGASQVDRFGNQNLSCIGDFRKPKAQLIGMRGSPGNTISHRTSYWVPNHGPRVFVAAVDVVCGVGYDRAAALPERSRRFHDVHRVVSNLGVFDFETPDRRMRLASRHAGVGVDEVVEQTGFELAIPDDVPETRAPTDDELRLIREVLDPGGLIAKELPS